MVYMINININNIHNKNIYSNYVNIKYFIYLIVKIQTHSGRRKRERIAALQKQPIITAIEIGYFITDKRNIRRAA